MRRADYARAYFPKWKAKNREGWLEYQRAYGRTHMAEKVEHAMKWQTEHRAIQNARIADWKRRNPDKNAEYSARRRARKLGVEYEVIDRVTVFQRDGYICHICLELVPEDVRTLDHIVPLARGGTHTYANVATAHMLCNQRKGTKIIG